MGSFWQGKGMTMDPFSPIQTRWIPLSWAEAIAAFLERQNWEEEEDGGVGALVPNEDII